MAKRNFNKDCLGNWRWWVALIPTVIMLFIAMVIIAIKYVIEKIEKFAHVVVTKIFNWVFNKA